jgi:hypothetical protein
VSYCGVVFGRGRLRRESIRVTCRTREIGIREGVGGESLPIQEFCVGHFSTVYRKKPFSNYESPALTGELQARINHALKHSISLRPTLKAQEISQNFGLRIADCGFGMEA